MNSCDDHVVDVLIAARSVGRSDRSTRRRTSRRISCRRRLRGPAREAGERRTPSPCAVRRVDEISGVVAIRRPRSSGSFLCTTRTADDLAAVRGEPALAGFDSRHHQSVGNRSGHSSDAPRPQPRRRAAEHVEHDHRARLVVVATRTRVRSARRPSGAAARDRAVAASTAIRWRWPPAPGAMAFERRFGRLHLGAVAGCSSSMTAARASSAPAASSAAAARRRPRSRVTLPHGRTASTAVSISSNFSAVARRCSSR